MIYLLAFVIVMLPVAYYLGPGVIQVLQDRKIKRLRYELAERERVADLILRTDAKPKLPDRDRAYKAIMARSEQIRREWDEENK